jgi:hypothetical protein
MSEDGATEVYVIVKKLAEVSNPFAIAYSQGTVTRHIR